LGDAFREMNQLQDALSAYKAAADAAANVADYKQKALLAAGEVSDMLSRREEAMLDYRAVIAMDGSSEEAGTARKLLDKPYRGH
jgi:tetratricopeptide (TPR) repeat protein